MSIFWDNNKNEEKTSNIIITIVISILAFWLFISVIGPIYGVWSAKKHGEAELARANQNRQITNINQIYGYTSTYQWRRCMCPFRA